MLDVTEGHVQFDVQEGVSPCQTFYKIIGDLGNKQTPLVALHGGPGVNHEYLLVLSDLSKSTGIPLVLYDQIGAGKSTHYPDKMGDASFWTDSLFERELENLLLHLKIQDGYYLCGHSWGGMLASRHASHQPGGLRKLILMSTPASMKLWVDAQNHLRSFLPQEIRDVLDKNEKDGTTDSEEYEGAVKAYYARHLCILDPMPEEIAAALAEISKDPTVYLTMCGPSEFYITGTLLHWTVVEEINKIKVPTLLINGDLDEAQDEVVRPFFEKINQVKWIKFANSSHMAHHEERERFMKELELFLLA